jgi:hypothetical protein
MTPLEIVTQERAKFGASLTNDQCVLVCNRVAVRLRNGEAGDSYTSAGLLTKKATQNHGTGPDGQFYAVDIVMFQDDGAHYDILIGSDAAAEPAWNFVGFLPIAQWRPPFAESGTDPIDPPLAACCQVCQNVYDHHGWGISEMRAALARIEAKLGTV